MQPGDERRVRRCCIDGSRGVADGVDLVGVEGLKEVLASGEVAVQRRHADVGATGDLGHRNVSAVFGERGTRSRKDLVAVALGVSASRGWSGGGHAKWRGYPLE